MARALHFAFCVSEHIQPQQTPHGRGTLETTAELTHATTCTTSPNPRGVPVYVTFGWRSLIRCPQCSLSTTANTDAVHSPRSPR